MRNLNTKYYNLARFPVCSYHPCEDFVQKKNNSNFRPERCWRVWSPAILSTALVGDAIPWINQTPNNTFRHHEFWPIRSNNCKYVWFFLKRKGYEERGTGKSTAQICLITFGTHFWNIMIHRDYYNASYIVEGSEKCSAYFFWIERAEVTYMILCIYIFIVYTLQFAYCLPCPCVAPGTIWWFSHGISQNARIFLQRWVGARGQVTW